MFCYGTPEDSKMKDIKVVAAGTKHIHVNIRIITCRYLHTYTYVYTYMEYALDTHGYVYLCYMSPHSRALTLSFC